MSRAAAVALAALLGALPLAGAAAAEESDELIRPGRSIGGVELQMTEMQVRRVLGTPSLRHVARGLSGRTIVTLSYITHYTVTLTSGRVSRVSTTLPEQRTIEGVGPGTRLAAFKRRLPNAGCTLVFGRGLSEEDHLDCTVRTAGTTTLFKITALNYSFGPLFRVLDGRVTEVSLSSAG
jgi:hypothetical protein